jgi:anti-sigma-K factor RskA
MTDPRCEETRELAAELALGVVEGEARGRALEHLADCNECRRRVDELAEVADELLMLAPQREVPIGFESRALAHLRPASRPSRRWRRLRLALVPATAAIAAAGITLAVVSGDLQLASHYRHTLDNANGKEFESYSLRAGDSQAGTVFSYEGSPSWVLVTVDPAHRAGLQNAELVLNDGSQVPLRWFHLDSGGGSGGAIPVDPNRVSVLRLTGADGQPLVARF